MINADQEEFLLTLNQNTNFTDFATLKVPYDLYVLAKAKLEKDLCQSFLKSPREIKNNWSLASSVLAAAGLPSLPVIYPGVDQVRTNAFKGLPNELLARELTAKLNERGTPLRVLITSIAAGPMAVFYSLQIRLKLRDFVEIYFHDVNGRDQIKTLEQSVQHFDFVIAPDGPFWLSTGDFRSIYQPLTPLFSEDQFILANCVNDPRKAKRIWVYPFSSAQLQFRAWVPAKRKSKRKDMERDWLASIREEPCAASDINRIAAELAHDDLVIAWEPLATEIIRQPYRKNNDSKKLVKVHEEPFPVIFTMFANVSNPDTNVLYEKFIECFVSEWNYCKANLQHAWNMLLFNNEYLAYFGAGAGMDVGHLLSSPTLQIEASRGVLSVEPPGFWNRSESTSGVRIINRPSPPNQQAHLQNAPVCFIIREEGRSTKVNAKAINITLVRIDPLSRNDRLEIPLRIALPTPEEMAYIDRYFASRPALSLMEAHFHEQLMTQIGSKLFQSIFSDNRANNELAKCRENHRSMEFVVEGSPAFQAIPWELMYYVFPHANQSMPIISQYPIFRQLTEPSEFHSREVPQKRLGILWVTARHPKEDFKKDAVLAEVRESLPTDQVDLTVIESGSFLEMIRVLEEHTRNPKYHVLHLDMHGIVSSPAELRSKHGQSDFWAMDYREAGLGNLANRGDSSYDVETSFVLFNQGDKVMPVSAAELSARLAVPGVPLVLLNACQSATVPASAPVPAVESSLIAHMVQAGGFPAVGFQQPTTLACTHLFFKTFYRTLLSNPNVRDIQESVHRGRRELHDNMMRGSIGIQDWWLPVLYTMPGRHTL